jgi:hypothetical protein
MPSGRATIHSSASSSCSRDDPVGARIFVEHDRQVDPLLTHVGQHVERGARLRHEQRLAHERGPVRRRSGAGRDDREHVLDVHHADDLVERIAIDRKARVPVLGEGGDDFLPACGRVERDDLAPRHGHVVGIVFGEMQEVAQHLPLDGRQVALAGGPFGLAAFLVLVDHFLELFAQGAFAIVGVEEFADREPEPAVTVRFSRLGFGVGHGP